MSKALYEEIINEIGEQTLARLGLNIFSFDTYNAYGASVTMSNETNRAYNQYKDTPEKFDKFFNAKYEKYKNAENLKPNFKKEVYFEQMYEQYKKDPKNFDKYFDKFYKQNKNNTQIFGKDAFMTDLKKRYSGEYSKAFGQYFEEFDIGIENIKSELFKKGERTYTTDTLFEIQKIQILQQSGKKLDNLNQKDRAKIEYISKHYADELKNMDFNSPDMQELIKSDTRDGKAKSFKNHTNTDTVTFDKNGKIIKKAQLKVIKDTKGLLQDRYLQNNDELRMPFDDYKKHKENLEYMIKNPTTNSQEKAKAQKALEMLNKNNFANRLMCENPKTTAVITQSVVAGAHIAQAGASDAVVVALSTLANGAVYEIKDALSGNSSVSIEKRIKRLVNAVIKSLKTAQGAFVRGAGFGGIDIAIGILGQIFKSIAGKLKVIWKELRNAAKSIYNAIYEFVSGKIESYEKLLSVIIKSFFSFSTIIASVGLESKLEITLAPLITPLIASFVAPALAIIVGSIAVVTMSKTIDFALETLFGVFAQAEISKKRYEEIAALCMEKLPQIIENRQMLATKMKQAHYERKLKFDTSFEGYKQAILNKDDKQSFEYLSEICKLYGAKLEYRSAKEILTNNTGKLQW